MKNVDLSKKNVLNPAETVEYFVLSQRKFLAFLRNTESEEFLAYYKGRKLILREPFARFLQTHPELRRRV